jgi:hypothetical protein
MATVSVAEILDSGFWIFCTRARSTTPHRSLSTEVPTCVLPTGLLCSPTTVLCTLSPVVGSFEGGGKRQALTLPPKKGAPEGGGMCRYEVLCM